MKLLALDMDGTCLNSYSKISPTTMDALYLARTSGIEIVPTTGRALSCIPHQLRKTRISSGKRACSAMSSPPTALLP